MKIDIIIVNWNSGSQLRTCIDSIIEFSDNLVSKIIIVDNNSNDDSCASVKGISDTFIIYAKKNLGFGRACNLGAQYADSEYLLFLNPDTELFENSLLVPYSFMENSENQNIGICGIQLVDEKGDVACTCARFPSLIRFVAQVFGLDKIPGWRDVGIRMKEFNHLSDKIVDQVIGAFFFTRKDVFIALRGFDERFFVYFEEVDFSLRALQDGYKSVYLSGAHAFHQGGGTSQQVKALRLFYSLRSRLLYGQKHFTFLTASLLLLLTLFVEPVIRGSYCLILRDWQGAINTFRGYRTLWAFILRKLFNRGISNTSPPNC